MNAGTKTLGAAADGRRARARAHRLGWLAYGAQAAALLLYVLVLWIQVYVDTRRMYAVAYDRFTESHRYWRLRTSLVFLIWTILGGLAIPFGLGWAIVIPAWLWHAYRVVRGALCYARGQPIAVARNTRAENAGPAPASEVSR